MSEDYFDQRKSRTNAALKAALGPQLARAYLIQGSGKRNGRFGLTLIDPGAIQYRALSETNL